MHLNRSTSHEPIAIDDGDLPYMTPEYEIKVEDHTFFGDATSMQHNILNSAPDEESLKLLPFIPRYMLDLPRIPPNCRWYCPAKGCTLCLHLKGSLPSKFLKLLTAEEINFLTQHAWTSKNYMANDILCKMAGRHFEDHLAELGLRLAGVSFSDYCDDRVLTIR